MMVLVLAIHSVSTVTAKVPFSMVALVDHIRRKDLPPELKCRQVRLRLQLAPQCRAQARAPALLRVLLCVCVLCGQCQSRLKRSQATLLKAGAALQVFPTSGGRSSSLWDVASIPHLVEWLDEHMDESTTNEVFEVRLRACSSAVVQAPSASANLGVARCRCRRLSPTGSALS